MHIFFFKVPIGRDLLVLNLIRFITKGSLFSTPTDTTNYCAFIMSIAKGTVCEMFMRTMSTFLLMTCCYFLLLELLTVSGLPGEVGSFILGNAINYQL